MSLYTCDIHGGSRHICSLCVHGELATAEEEVVRLEDDMREGRRAWEDIRALTGGVVPALRDAEDTLDRIFGLHEVER